MACAAQQQPSSKARRSDEHVALSLAWGCCAETHGRGLKSAMLFVVGTCDLMISCVKSNGGNLASTGRSLHAQMMVTPQQHTK